MSTLYIECKMGIAGDMLSAALLEICPDREEVLKSLNEMGLPGVEFVLTSSEKCGVTGSHMDVIVNGVIEDENLHSHGEHSHEHSHEEHHHEHEHSHDGHDHEHGHEHSHDEGDHSHSHHAHRSMKDIENIVSALKIDDAIKADVMNIYKLIAEAESKVHGKTVSEIHFHEVGSMDAIADITAAATLIRRINPDEIIVSPIHVGSGMVRCAHGILPVPAPATALLLEGIPSYSGEVKGELCTPTGAALAKYFANSFGPQPIMKVEKIGYGMGKKDFPQANCVRAFLGESSVEKEKRTDVVTELVCNLDDMTPEEIGYAVERLMDDGALDVFTTPIGMKKNRPGVMMTVLCKEDTKADLIKKIFQNTTTIGIRESICKRYILDRTEKSISTSDGDIRVKEVSGYGVSRSKMEYEDLAAIADKKGCSIFAVKEQALKSEN